MGHIRLVTSRPLEVGFKPDKGQSAPFALNMAIPFGPINRPTVLSLVASVLKFCGSSKLDLTGPLWKMLRGNFLQDDGPEVHLGC